MITAWSVADVRAAEAVRLAQVPEGALMQRAAARLAAVCAGELKRRGRVTGSRVVLLVGAGNNGGDALWAGALLARRGARVDAVLLSAHVHPDGLAALRAAGGRAADPAQAGRELLARTDLVVDGIVGLGGSPGLREPAASLVVAVPTFATVVAVDLPSGVDPDTGEAPAAHVVADVTVTFGAPKPCLLLPPASRAAGRVVEVDLGLIPLLASRDGSGRPGRPLVERLETSDAARLWPVPGSGDDKYRRGVLGVVAGSDAYPGAAVLAVGGALRSGVGMVRYLGPPGATAAVRSRWPEVVAGDGRVQAWLVGSGVDPQAQDGQMDAVRRALDSALPVVVDAGALELAVRLDPQTGRRDGGRPWLLTPHAGEAARLLSLVGGAEVTRAQVEARPSEHARQLAAHVRATVLLKGSTTLVTCGAAAAEARTATRSQADAPAWLATAGAGDVLAGVCGALLAAGLDPLDAGSLAALAHGRAAQRASGGGPIIADDVVTALPATVAALLAGSG